MTDLNERVEARIEEYALDVQGSQSNEGATILRLVESWRERWNRHQPRGDDPTLWYCFWCAGQGGGGWPCPDASSVLREIGIEP